MLAAWARDLRYAMRSLTRQRGTAAVAVLSLGLGVGVATTAFTLLNAMALRDLPGVKAQDRLVMLGVSLEQATGRRLRTLLSVPEVELLAGHGELFSGMTAAGPTEVAVAVGGEPAAMPAEVTLANHFRVLGTRPELGRFFTPEDNRPGATTAVVSHGVGQRSLGGRPDVVGRDLRVNGRVFTVIGVAPEGFTGMTPGDVLSGPGGDPALWLPMGAASAALPPWARAGARSPESQWLRVAARLRDGVTAERLASALPRVSAELERAYPDAGRGAQLVTGDLIFGPGAGRWRATLTVLAFMVVPLLVLLIAAANAANLLLARTLSRRRELAVRSALGASRGALARSVVAESVLLAGAGGVLGLAVAVWSRQLASLFAVRLVSAAPLDLRVFGFTLAASVSVGLLFGLVPALGAGRPAAGAALSGASRSGETRAAAGIRRGLVVAQVAL
ncbi:MAG: ABC transporter permease, partial [Gemmatimonadota bacterium]